MGQRWDGISYTLGGRALPSREVPDDDDPVKPLTAEERRKLFDLPEPRPSAPPPTARARPKDEPLELDVDRSASAPKKVIATVRVGGMTVQVIKFVAAGAVAGALLIGLIRIVYRY